MTLLEDFVIDGNFVPGNASSLLQRFSWRTPLHASRSAGNFKDSDSIVSERQQGDARFAANDFGATQPFSMGRRGCLVMLYVPLHDDEWLVFVKGYCIC